MYLLKGIHKDTIEIGDDTLFVLLHLDNLNKIDGLYEIRYVYALDDDLEIITGIIDDNLNQVIPLQKEKISKSDFGTGRNIHYVKLFPNKKAIYKADKNECYIVDLTNTEFVHIDEKVIPKNYVKKFDFWCDLGYGNIICSRSDKFVLYDVVNLREKSVEYDLIIPESDDNNSLSAFYVFKEFSINIKMTLHLDGSIDSKASINNVLDIYIPNDIMDDRQAIIDYAISCLDTLYKKPDGVSM